MEAPNQRSLEATSDIKLTSEITVKSLAAHSSDEDIASAARVSTYGADSADSKVTKDRNRGLINFLMRNRHGSPFEHTSFTFYIHAPIFAIRHLMRHRTWSFNEESARYRELEPVFYQPAYDRLLRQKGKPGNYVFHEGDDVDYQIVLDETSKVYSMAWNSYKRVLEQGVAREVARLVLPNAIYTSAYATCNARALMTFLSLRTVDPNALFPSFPQHEITVIAGQMEKFFAESLPITYDAFNSSRRVAP